MENRISPKNQTSSPLNFYIMKRSNGESAADFYYRLSGGESAETQADHITAMQNALVRCVKSGECQYSQEDNGDGAIHVYAFEKGQAPTFDTNSQDVFNQIRIIEG